MSEVILDKDFKYIELREKLDELGREVEFLKAKLSKELREKYKLEEKNKSLASLVDKFKRGRIAKDAERYKRMKPHYESNKNKIIKLKNIQYEKSIEIEFYKKRIKECFGMDGYKKVMLHKDLPRLSHEAFERIRELKE